nr:hypothetical protein [Tanacetum cinerariifolium]
MKDTLSSCSNSDEQQMQQIQDKAKKSCMVSFRRLHSHLKILSNNDLKGTRTECGFKRAFVTLFGQDVETFTRTMFLNMDQLEKQLDKEEFQEIGSMAAFRMYKIVEKVDTSKALDASLVDIQSSGTKFKKHDTSSRSGNDVHADDADIKPVYNEEPMTEMYKIVEKVDTSKALDASLVDIQSSGTKFKKHDTSSRSGNDVHADDVDIKPVYDEEPMTEVTTGKIFTSSTTTIDSEPPNGSNTDITNIHDCIQHLDSSAGTSINVQKEQTLDLNAGKFLDDLHKNAFSGTNGEDAVEHIEYFLKIVDPIDLPNVNQDKLKASKFVNYKMIDIFTKGALWDYWKLGSDEIEPTNDETSDLGEIDHDDKQEIGEIFKIETNLFDYETPLCEKFKEFNYLLKIDPHVLTNDKGFKTYDKYKDDWIYELKKSMPWVHENHRLTLDWREDGYCNEGNFPGAYIVGNMLHYQYLEWYEALKDIELKEEALINKSILEGLINEYDESSNNGWRRWDGYEIGDHDQEEREHENEHEDEKRCELFDDHELPVYIIRRFKMIKYSFGRDKGYVAIKEDEYEDLMNTSK